MGVLTDRHRRDFARNGFVVLDSAVDDRLVAEARGAVKGDPNVAIDENQNEPAEAREVFRSLNRQFFAYADDLVGGEQLKRPDDPNFGTYSDEQSRVYPRTAGEGHITDPAAATDPKVDVHTDDQTDGDGALSALNVGLYLDHVPPRNGGFTVWPGSHWVTAEHCELESPNMDADSGTRARAPGLRVRPGSPYADMGDLYAEMEPFEIAGDAGSVILWHRGLVHSSGVHLQPGRLRLAAFSRFHIVPDAWEPADVRHPFTNWQGIDDEVLEGFPERPSRAGD